MVNFLPCFRDPSSASTSNRQDESTLLESSSDPSRPVKSECIFCNVTPSKGFNVVYENEDLIAFKDRSPGASTHLLIIPRYHLIHDLTPPHIPMIRQMALLGTTLTQTQSESESREIKMGFHIPPFSSVHHLHLHVLVPPYNLRGKLKYPVSHRTSGEGKGWGWFVSVDQVLSILENGQKVGLGSSASPSSNSNTSTSRQRSA